MYYKPYMNIHVKFSENLFHSILRTALIIIAKFNKEIYYVKLYNYSSSRSIICRLCRTVCIVSRLNPITIF